MLKIVYWKTRWLKVVFDWTSSSIGHHFLIETDMMSFPNMLKFKQKHLPKAQLLRWANWFSNWSFDAVHINGKTIILPDFLSRLKKEKSIFKNQSLQAQQHSLPQSSFDIISSSQQSFPTYPPMLQPVYWPLEICIPKKLISVCVRSIFFSDPWLAAENSWINPTLYKTHFL